MPTVAKTPTNWAKDGVLKDQILQALDVTEDQADLVFTVSVQGHGKYPMEQKLQNPAITVEACPDEEYRYAMEYYVNQVHEMDAFVGELIEELSQRDERTVLVLYGDHLPALNLEAEDMESSSLYRTEYIICSGRSPPTGRICVSCSMTPCTGAVICMRARAGMNPRK